MMSIEEQPGSGWYFNLHKSIGLVVAGLVALRLGWRVTHTPAPLPTSVPAWQAKLAALTQSLLYVCMVLMPLTGFSGAVFSKHGLQFFGHPMALPVIPNHDTAELFFTIHGIVVWILVALIALHATGGLKHLLLDRDGVFYRMWRWLR